jgi:hypothetical protein
LFFSSKIIGRKEIQLMALPGQILGIQGIGGSQNLLNLELLGMMEILMGITLLSELNQRNPQITQANPFGNALTQGSGLPAFVPSIAGGGSSQTLVCPSSNGGIQQIPPVGYLPASSYGSNGITPSVYGLDQTGLSPIAQNSVPFQNGVPVVTNQNKSQAIAEYLQTHASFRSPQDIQYLENALNQLTPGELNLLFQEGTSYKFTNNDPTFQQNPNILGYEEDLNNNNQRTNPSIVINENFVQQNANNPLVVEQDILHETTHALDFGVAAALGLPTEFASTSSPLAQAAIQNYDALQPRGVFTWDNTPTDPTGKYPTISTEPSGADLIGDAGKIFFTGGGAQIAAQDPLTYAALNQILSAADNIGNSLVGL